MLQPIVYPCKKEVDIDSKYSLNLQRRPLVRKIPLESYCNQLDVKDKHSHSFHKDFVKGVGSFEPNCDNNWDMTFLFEN